MGIIGKTRLETCPHVQMKDALWVKNDQEGAPVLFVAGLGQNIGIYLTLTNQTIYAKCGACFAEVIEEGRRLRKVMLPE